MLKYEIGKLFGPRGIGEPAAGKRGFPGPSGADPCFTAAFRPPDGPLRSTACIAAGEKRNGILHIRMLAPEAGVFLPSAPGRGPGFRDKNRKEAV